MRRPRGPFSHMPARETSLDVRLGVHRPLGPPGPTHANYAHNTRLAPEQLGVLSDLVEFYGQIAALLPRGVRNLRFMLICCCRATGILARRQHSKARRRVTDPPSVLMPGGLATIASRPRRRR